MHRGHGTEILLIGAYFHFFSLSFLFLDVTLKELFNWGKGLKVKKELHPIPYRAPRTHKFCPMRIK